MKEKYERERAQGHWQRVQNKVKKNRTRALAKRERKEREKKHSKDKKGALSVYEYVIEQRRWRRG